MNELKEIEIIEFMKSLWPDTSVRVCMGKAIEIDIEKDYGSVGVSFDRLLKMVEFFGTKNIDMSSSFSAGGCPTCSYGDEHILTFTVKP